MKSRMILSSPVSSSLRARAPQLSATRRFELARVPCRRRDKRRGGQALLLAVLIMLLAALLSAGFLAVLSGNLNQTARIADKTRAIEASRAGVQFANQQLSYSGDGDQWRPDVPGAPSPLYYSQLDRVQGWDAQGYAKYPDPNQPIGNAPTFLLKVDELPLDTNAPYYNTNPSDRIHAGETKITSIGLSDDDPNVFHKTIAYKTGPKQSPWAQALRSISNWNYKGKDSTGRTVQTVSSGIAESVTTDADGNSQVTLKPLSPNSPQTINFPGMEDKVPFNVVISTPANGGNPATTQGAVATQVDPTGAVLTLAGAVPVSAGARIEMAAALGTASTIDLLNTGQAPTAAVPLTFPTQPQSNGILANGGSWLQGQIRISDLNKFGTKLVSSGALAVEGNTKPVVAPNPLPATNYGIAGDGVLVSSEANNFPGTFTTDSGQDVTPFDLVKDGFKRGTPTLIGLSYGDSGPRTVEPFQPVQIDSKENLKRYRTLARDGNDGIYIGNADDVEKIGVAPMTQAQLTDMWLSPESSTASYTRTAAASTAAADSLEQKHLRGWVGPSEFLPRGALVELLPGAPNPYIRVTLDARADNTSTDATRDQGPVLDKTWRDDNGNLQQGVYSKTFLWPKNGVIFAEGNIRIRGKVNVPAPTTLPAQDPYPSLTVISMNNIYVEGSVSLYDRDAPPVPPLPENQRKKLMLLARNNVVANPTGAILQSPDAQSVSTNTAAINVTGTSSTFDTVTIPVANALTFHKGDYVDIDSGVTPLTGVISAVNVGANTIEVQSYSAGAILANSVVRSPLEKRVRDAPASTQVALYSVVDAENAINRRIVASAFVSSASSSLTSDHVGELKKNTSGEVVGLNIKPQTVPPFNLPSEFKLTNKQTIDASDNLTQDQTVSGANKLLRIYQNELTPEKDSFPDPIQNYDLAAMTAEITASPGNSDATTQFGYKYLASLIEATTLPTDVAVLPYYALSGVGLRYDVGYNFDPNSADPYNDNQRQVFDATTGYTIPLATSVRTDFNGILFNAAGNPTSNTRWIGFNPDYFLPNTTVAGHDDPLTVDRFFYQENVRRSTLDSTRLAGFVGVGDQSDGFVRRQSPFTPAIAVPGVLPEYRLRAMKLENSSNNVIRPTIPSMDVDAYVYAQQGSWFVIPGDYFRSDPPVRTSIDGKASYIDYDKSGDATVDAGEYVDVNGNDICDDGDYADLNRNGQLDFGEANAAIRFTRYNSFQIRFLGAILENQTAVVNSVPGATVGSPSVVNGAVADWMDKWVSYNNDTNNNSSVDGPLDPDPIDTTIPNWKFVNYTYDPSLANETPGAKTLRVPQNGDLLYQQ